MGYPYIAIGSTPLIDLRSDTVAADSLLSGITAHDKNGNPIVGTVESVPWDALASHALSGFATGQSTSIHGAAFMYWSGITGASFPLCRTIGNSAFMYCSTMSTVSFPVCTWVGLSAFYGCYALSSVYLPVCSYANNGAFYACSSLTEIEIPMLESVTTSMFNGCIGLETASFPVASVVNNYAFARCSNLQSVYLMSTSMATLSNSNAFSSTHASLKIYVPSNLYSQYISAANWSYFSSRFVSA